MHLSIVHDEEDDDETADISKNMAYFAKKYWQNLRKNGTAVELPHEEMVTLDGRIMKNEAESYGRNTKCLLTRLN
jgi:hypothetical protein